MNNTDIEEIAAGDYAFRYIPLVLIGIAISNILTIILIACIKELRHQATMNYVFLMAISDTVSLFLWNLNRFTSPVLGISLEFVTLASCKALVFLQYTSLQTSALLVCIICIDHLAYLIMTRNNHQPFVHSLPFNTKKSARLWSLAILVITFLTNLHILIFNGNPTDSSSGVQCYSAIYDIGTVMNTIHLVVYTFIPIVVVVFVDIGIIALYCKRKYQAQYPLNQSKQRANQVLPTQETNSSTVARSSTSFKQDFSDHSKSMTFTVLFVSISFIILTQPSAILFGFFENSPFYLDKNNRFIFESLDAILFFNHCIIFFKCLFSSLFRFGISKSFNRIYNFCRCNFTVKEYEMNEF